MTSTTVARICFWCLASAGLTACGTGIFEADTKPTPVVWKDPAGFPPMVIPLDNPLTEEGIALGRRLFYDPVLSADSSMSCATCHIPQLAFTDGRAVSEGVVGLEGTRSAMSLVNIGYYHTGLFWDGRSPSLEEQAFHPVRDPKEMAFNWPEAVRRLQQAPQYVRWFKEAFSIRNAREIDSMLVAKALAQFERTLVSSNTKFDRVMREEAAFTPAEKRGWTIFFDASQEMSVSECNHCHVDPLFSDLNYHNNGVQQAPVLEGFADPGQGGVTGNRFDLGRFRVPTLRNVLLTAPYMHDGRFKTMDEVLDHYASGGHAAENLNANVRKLYLSAQNRADMMAFFGTLTDTVFLRNPAFQNPW